MAILTTSQDDLQIITSLQKNLVAHMLFFPERMRFCSVVKAQELIIINTHIPNTMHNVVLNAQLHEDNAQSVIKTAMAYFARENTPFAWWVGPEDMPQNLPHILQTTGMPQIEINIGMHLAIEHYSFTQTTLRVERVLEYKQIEDYIAIILDAHKNNTSVHTWYNQLRKIPFTLHDYEQLYVGYLDDIPVTCGSLTLHSDIAGIYNLVTNREYRKQGLGTAMMQELITRAQETGFTHVGLIAQKGAVSMHERLGFDALCEFFVHASE